MLASLIAAALLQQSPPPLDDGFIRDATVRRMDFVILHQVIDDENVERVGRLLEPGEILDLQSTGGPAPATVRLAHLVRERDSRVRVTGECLSGCAVVWATANDRLIDGFTAVTFRESPISQWASISRNRQQFSDEQVVSAETEDRAFRALLAEARIEPWLFQCAYRLMAPRNAGAITANDGYGPSLLGGEYSRVWFPATILTRAGVRGLDRYDAPNPRQRDAIETEQGTRRTPLPIYWAKDGDCDPEITAAASEAG